MYRSISEHESAIQYLDSPEWWIQIEATAITQGDTLADLVLHGTNRYFTPPLAFLVHYIVASTHHIVISAYFGDIWYSVMLGIILCSLLNIGSCRSVWLLVMLIIFRKLLVRTELDYRWALWYQTIESTDHWVCILSLYFSLLTTFSDWPHLEFRGAPGVSGYSPSICTKAVYYILSQCTTDIASPVV